MVMFSGPRYEMNEKYEPCEFSEVADERLDCDYIVLL